MLDKAYPDDYNPSEIVKSIIRKMDIELYWDSSFAVARRLMEAHPEADLENLTLQTLHDWVIALPEFADDPQLANDDLLNAILREWYEEVNPL